MERCARKSLNHQVDSQTYRRAKKVRNEPQDHRKTLVIFAQPNTRSIEIRLEEEKAQKHGKVFNWETAKYGRIWYDEDVHDLRFVETEFPAIIFNDNLTSNETLSCEPTVSSLNDNEIDFRISFDESDDEDYTVIFDENSFSYKIIYVDDLKTDLENDNDKVNMPLLPSPEPSVSYFYDLDFFKDFEKKIPAIVYNDALTSKSDFLTEPTVCPQHIDESDLENETSLSECEKVEQNILYFNDLLAFNVIYPDDLKSDTDNDNDKIDIEQPSGDMSVIPSPNVINVNTQGPKSSPEFTIGRERLMRSEVITRIPEKLVCRRTCQLGDEGLSSGGTNMILIFIIAKVILPSPSSPRKFTSTFGAIHGTRHLNLPKEENQRRYGRLAAYGGGILGSEHDQQAKMKATPRKLDYVDFDKEAPAGSLARGFSDRFSLESSATSETHKKTCSASKSRRTPSKNKEPPHLRRSRRLEDQSITKEKARRERRAKLPQNIRVYEGNKDPKDHLGIFSAAAEQEEWLMPVWCKMFCQTLGGAARNWFDDLDPKSVDSFEELSQKFLEEFSQQKRYAKDPTEIHDIKRRQDEDLQAFMDRFKSESSHIKGVPSVLRILAFMHGHAHPELAKKLNDKIPKTMDEMFERVRAFIKGEVAAGSAEMVRPSQGDKGYIRLAWTGGPKKARNRGSLREFRRNIGVYTPYP
ncbi:reverse transcriptase domain-containing protein [Tanacetum coccineum]